MFGNKAIHEIYKRLDVHTKRINRLKEDFKFVNEEFANIYEDLLERIQALEHDARKEPKPPWWKFWS